MREKSNYVRVLLCTLFLMGAICTAVAGEVIYLDADATGVNSGSSWANAHWCLQDALADARRGDEIRPDSMYEVLDTALNLVMVDKVKFSECGSF